MIWKLEPGLCDVIKSLINSGLIFLLSGNGMEKVNYYINKFLQSSKKIYNKQYELVSSKEVEDIFKKLESWFNENFSEGEKVAIYLSNDHFYPLAVLAAMNSGVVFIPMREEWPMERVEQIRKISQFKILLDKDLLEEILSCSVDSIRPSRAREIDGESPLYIMFTSGSTGEPKGVEILRNSYGNFLSWIDDSFEEINSDDRLLNSTHYTFDVAFMELGLLLTKNVAFYSSNMGQNPLVLARELDQLKISISVTVPNNYNLLLSEKIFDEINLSSLKSVLLAGSRFPTPLWHKFKELLPEVNLYNCFGPTEATIYCLFKKMTSEEELDICDETVSIGKALSNLKAIVIDEKGNELGVGQKGELIVGGIQVMSKYVNSEELTNEALLNREGMTFYKTGDLAFRNSNDEYFIVGRNDDTVKVSGQRVNLSDVDSYILKLGEVKECATVAVHNELTNYKLICFVELEQDISVMDLKNKLKKTLLPFQIPSQIIFKESLPINNSGKIDKRALKESL